MAARPFRTAFIKKVGERGGWAPILERIAGGETLRKLAADYGCSAPWLYRVLTDDKDREALYRAARRESALVHAEDGLDILDNADVTGEHAREELAKAKERAGYRRWLSSKYDADTFGDKQQQGVTVSIGDLHLQALMTPMQDRLLPPAPAAAEAEYEVLSTTPEVK